MDCRGAALLAMTGGEAGWGHPAYSFGGRVGDAAHLYLRIGKGTAVRPL